MEWTDEAISRLRSLWQEGLSTAEIGRRLSITKNAVVGKAHRLTLPPRPSPIRKADPGRLAKTVGANVARRAERREAARVASFVPRSAARTATATALEPEASAAVGATVTRLHQARAADPADGLAAGGLSSGDAERAATARPSFGRRMHSCCWPLGEPGTKQFRFCGAEPIAGKPYCTEHAQLAYVKLRDRRDTVA